MTVAGWEQFDVDADVGVRAWGPTRAEAFAQAALGVFALIVSPDEVDEREHREVRAQADSPETLLVRSEEHTSELQSLAYLVCRLLLEKKKNTNKQDVVRGGSTCTFEESDP